MRSDLDLLVAQISNLNLRAYQHGEEAKRLARDIGELQAIAIAVAAATSEPEVSIADRSCSDRMSHRAHLWREDVLEVPSRPVVYRCEGRNTDLT